MEKIPCTVGILTFNSGATLARALESVQAFSEIIICDGGSSDETRAIAEKYGCVILDQAQEFKDTRGKIADFSGVRNQILNKAKEPWLFFLDSDEYIDSGTVQEIGGIINENIPAAYWVPRKYVIEGKVIDNATTYPNYQMRFFHRNEVTHFIKPVHERIELKPSALVKKMHDFIYVPMEGDIMFWRKKWDYYLDIEVAKFKTISLWKWLKICYRNSMVSGLYAFRLLKISFKRGTKMPLGLEWERQRYNIMFCIRLIPKVRLS